MPMPPHFYLSHQRNSTRSRKKSSATLRYHKQSFSSTSSTLSNVNTNASSFKSGDTWNSSDHIPSTLRFGFDAHIDDGSTTSGSLNASSVRYGSNDSQSESKANDDSLISTSISNVSLDCNYDDNDSRCSVGSLSLSNKIIACNDSGGNKIKIGKCKLDLEPMERLYMKYLGSEATEFETEEKAQECKNNTGSNNKNNNNNNNNGNNQLVGDKKEEEFDNILRKRVRYYKNNIVPQTIDAIGMVDERLADMNNLIGAAIESGVSKQHVAHMAHINRQNRV